MKNNHKNANVIACIFLVIGIISTLLGIAFSKDMDNYHEKCTATTKAVVIDMKSSNKKGIETRRTTYTATVEYTVGSKTYTHRVQNPGKKDIYDIGEMIEIHYDPENPETAYVEREEAGHNIASVGMTVCGIFIILSVIIIFAAGRRSK